MCVLCACGSTKILIAGLDRRAAEPPGPHVCAERTIRETDVVGADPGRNENKTESEREHD